MKVSSAVSAAKFGLYGAATAATAVLGAAANRKGLNGWYGRLKKAPFQPPPAAFGPVWTALYALMAWSAWRVSEQPPSPERKRALKLWWAQLGLNAAWSPLFFGWRRPRAAMADILALAFAIAAYASAAGRVDRRASLAVSPYLAWVAFASVLNAEIVRRNRRVR